MQIDTRFEPLKVTNATNVTGTLTEPTPTVTPPTGDGVVDMGIATKSGGGITLGAMLANALKIIPFGVGASTNTFTLKAYGWDLTAPGLLGPTGLWIPHLLASFTCTLCTQAGVGSSDIASTQLFCGTIALVTGNANVSNEVVSPTGNVIAHIILDAKGCALVELRFTVGTNTSCNAAAKRL